MRLFPINKNLLIFGFFFALLFLLSGNKVEAASYNFSPSVGAFIGNCTSEANLFADASGESSIAGDIIINYNPAEITILDTDPMQAGVQIIPGTAYGTYTANFADSGMITLVGDNIDSGIPLTSNELFATIRFRSAPGVTSSTFTIQFDGPGATTDSNIADSVTFDDLLTSVTNGSFTFNTDPCIIDDVNPPVVTFVSPTNGTTNVSVNSPININITDDFSGVDLSTVVLTINGVVYPVPGPNVNVSGPTTNYTITFTPPASYPYNSPVTVSISGQDFSGKPFDANMSFTTEPEPNNNAYPIAVNDFASTPYETQVTINPLANDYDPDGSLVFSSLAIIGPPANGTAVVIGATGQISYTPNAGFSGDDIFQYMICDNGGLCSAAYVTVTVGANPVTPPPPVSTPVEPPVNPPVGPPTSPPTIIMVDPTEGELNVPVDTNITIHIIEGPSGIDFSTLTFVVDGITIDTTSPYLSVTFQNGRYIFVINLPNDFPGSKVIDVIISGRDLSGNFFQKNTFFRTTTPIEEVIDFLIGKGNIDLGVFEGTPFGNFVEQIGISGLISLITAILLATIILFNISNIFGILLTIFAILINKRKRPWGVILDGVSGKPISFATCRLVDAKTLEIIGQTVSDLDGTYGFPIRPGTYFLEIRHPNYKVFREKILIPENEDSYVYDVQMAPIDSAYVSQMKLQDKVGLTFLNIYNTFRDFLFLVGFLFASLSIMIAPSIWNWFIFIAYIIVFTLNTVIVIKRNRVFSAVIDAFTGSKVPYAIVKIYELNTWKNLDTLVCNSSGFFDYFGVPGEYGIIVASRGYKFPSRFQKDLPIISEMYSGMVKAFLRKGQNKLSLYMDPEEGVDVQVNESSRSKLQNPFD